MYFQRKQRSTFESMNSMWRTFYQVLELGTLFYRKEDISTFKVRPCFCWRQKSLPKVTKKHKDCVALQDPTHPASCPVPHPNHTSGLSAEDICINSCIIYGNKSCLLSSSPKPCSHPFLMKNRNHAGREGQRPWETPSFLPPSFAARAKSISKLIQLKRMWKHRTACTLVPCL